MIFQKTLKYIKEGKKLRRIGWNKDSYIIFSDREQILFVKNWNESRGLNISFSIDKFINGHVVSWLVNYSDLYSDDWEVVI